MKLAAWRDAIDRADAQLLLTQMTGTAEEIWATVKSMISGIHFMELRDLVNAVLRGNLLTARQWVADARREHVNWASIARPHDFKGRELTVAAGLVELFARRAGKEPPHPDGIFK